MNVCALQHTDQSTGYKEDASKGPMLRFEDSLPRLPVPTLEETAKRYLRSVHPLLSKSEYAQTEKAVNDFISPDSLGQTLQKRLIARRETPDIKNWIHEWWNNAAYLGYRDPVVPYVSYFYSHRDDRKRRDPAKRAAAITSSVLDFRKQVVEGTLEPEYMKKLPIAMSSYEYMFNCCRIPAKPADYPKQYAPNDHKYITVVRKNQFFKVFHEVNGKELTTKELEQQFLRIYQLAEDTPAVGVMTTENRDTWTEVSGEDEETREQALTALDARCLDRSEPCQRGRPPNHRGFILRRLPGRGQTCNTRRACTPILARQRCQPLLRQAPPVHHQ